MVESSLAEVLQESADNLKKLAELHEELAKAIQAGELEGCQAAELEEHYWSIVLYGDLPAHAPGLFQRLAMAEAVKIRLKATVRELENKRYSS